MLRETPQLANIDVYCGRTFRKSWLITDAAGDPADCTGVTFRAMARTAYPDVAALITFTCAVSNGDATNDKLTLSVTAATTLTLGATLEHESTTLIWDCEAEEASGDISPIFVGTCTATPEATR